MAKKRPITSTLVSMAVGGTEVFPLDQRDSVCNTISRQGFKRPDMKWSIATDKKAKKVSVVRIK